MIQIVKVFSIVNEAEVNFFFKFPCFFYHLVDVGNLISGSSAFSKSSMYTWNFSVQVLLKPSLKGFEHYLANKWNKCNFLVVWTSFGITFLWYWNESWPFQSCGHCWVFQICWHIECNTLTASSFRIWISSTGILSHPLPLFVVILPKVHLTSHSRISGSRWVTTLSWLSGSLRLFIFYSSVYFCHLFLISSASVSTLLFLSFIVPIFVWNVPFVSPIFLEISSL